MAKVKEKRKNRLRSRRCIVDSAMRDFKGQERRPAVQRRILVINRNYQPITTISLKKAINKLFNETAVIILPPGADTNVWCELTWDDWADLKPREGESVLAAAKRVFKIPEIIKTLEFADLPQRKVKLSRRAIYKRDNHTCQYCGKKAPVDIDFEDLTIDHILPKCQGGKTSWENMALACVACNRKKDNKTPEEAHMPLLKVPRMPDYDILQGRVIRVDSWQHFLGDCFWEVPLKD